MSRTDRSRRLVLGLTVATLAAAGCADGPSDQPTADEDVSADPVDDEGDLLALDAECRSQEQGYVVSYPESWHVNDGEHLPSCSAFDPDPVQLEDGEEVPTDLAATIRREPVSFEEASDLEAAIEQEHSAKDVLIAERPARVVEVEATGEGLHAAGLVTYRYYVDWGSDTLIAETYDVADTEYAFEERRDLLDAMMDHLEPTDTA